MTVLPSDRFRAEGRYLGLWELETYAACDLAPARRALGIGLTAALLASPGVLALLRIWRIATSPSLGPRAPNLLYAIAGSVLLAAATLVVLLASHPRWREPRRLAR